jgi:hypothetical protein
MTRPFYVLAASVGAGNRIRNFHGVAPGSLSTLLWTHPRIRQGSFDVAIPSQATLGDDHSLEQRWDDRKLLRVYQDGAVFFRCAADHEFLGWSSPEEFARHPMLNLVAVVELHLSFSILVSAIFDRLKSPFESVEFGIRLSDGVWEGNRLCLPKYYARGLANVVSPEVWQLQATPAEVTCSLSSDLVSTRPGHTAFQLLRHFVAMFDMDESEIPFTVTTEHGPKIDIEQIRAL